MRRRSAPGPGARLKIETPGVCLAMGVNEAVLLIPGVDEVSVKAVGSF